LEEADLGFLKGKPSKAGHVMGRKPCLEGVAEHRLQSSSSAFREQGILLFLLPAPLEPLEGEDALNRGLGGAFLPERPGGFVGVDPASASSCCQARF